MEPTRLAQILANDLGGDQACEPSFLVLFGAAQPKRAAARVGQGKPWVLQHPTMALAEGASSKEKPHKSGHPYFFSPPKTIQ